MILKFKAIVRKVGNSHVVTVPSDFISSSNVPTGKELEFSVEVPDVVVPRVE